METHVTTHSQHGITTIEFFNPKGNSLPTKMINDLCQEIHFAGVEVDTKVIILKSGGDGAFCAGASLEELAAITNETEGQVYFSGIANLINTMRKCTKLIVGRIHGNCVGGGVGIAASVDYAIAVEGVQIKLSELQLGIGPFVVGPAIERKIGMSAYSQLALDASLWRNSEWAKRKGLFAEVHPSVEQLDESVNRLCNNLSTYNPEALAEMKKVFWRATEHWDQLLKERAAMSGKLVLSQHSKKALEKIHIK